MDDHWKPNGGQVYHYLTLSIVFVLCLLYTKFLPFFFFFFFFFISSLCLILAFCCFAISLLRHYLIIVQERLFFFGGYPLLARCLIIRNKADKQDNYTGLKKKDRVPYIKWYICTSAIKYDRVHYIKLEFYL